MDRQLKERLLFLSRVTKKEVDYLHITDQRVFSEALTTEKLKTIAEDVELAERLDAFVSRFSRLQDNLDDKMLPALLTALGEKTGPFIHNLDRAERFGWVNSVEDWMNTRQLRNKMVHEYIEDTRVLVDALNAGHRFVPELIFTANQLTSEAQKRLQDTR